MLQLGEHTCAARNAAAAMPPAFWLAKARFDKRPRTLLPRFCLLTRPTQQPICRIHTLLPVDTHRRVILHLTDVSLPLHLQPYRRVYSSLYAPAAIPPIQALCYILLPSFSLYTRIHRNIYLRVIWPSNRPTYAYMHMHLHPSCTHPPLSLPMQSHPPSHPPTRNNNNPSIFAPPPQHSPPSHERAPPHSHNEPSHVPPLSPSLSLPAVPVLPAHNLRPSPHWPHQRDGIAAQHTYTHINTLYTPIKGPSAKLNHVFYDSFFFFCI
jgi:hypothetical protein